MSYIGRNPKWNTQTNTPQSADPANPVEGMVFYSDGTSRAEGLWVYINNAWQQVGASISDLSVYAQFDAEDLDVSNFTNVATTSTNPLNGDNSYEITTYTADFGTITIPERAKGKTNVLEAHASISSGSAKLVIRDQAANVLDELIIDNTETAKIVMPYTVLSSTTSITLSIEDESSAGTVKIDDIIFSDDAINAAEIEKVGNWESWTPTGTWNTNVTYEGLKRQVGEQIEYQVKITCSGTPNSAALTVNLPTDDVIDDSKLLGNQSLGLDHLGSTYVLDLGVQEYEGRVAYVDTTTIAPQVFTDNSNLEITGFITETSPFTFNTGDTIVCRFSVPIIGLTASSQNIISSTDSVQPSKYTTNAAQTIGASSTAIIDFEDVEYDEDNLVTTGASWKWTAPRNGDVILVSHIFDNTLQTASEIRYEVFVNGSRRQLLDSSENNTGVNTVESLGGTAEFKVSKDDEVDVRIINNGSTTFDLTADNQDNYISIRYTDKKALALVDVEEFQQTKLLSADVTSDGVVSDLTFNNLEIGKFYSIQLQHRFVHVSDQNGTSLVIANGATTIGQVQHDPSENTTTTVHGDSGSWDFRATDTSLTFTIAGAAATRFLGGNGTKNETFATLIELSNRKETTKFS